MAYHNKVLAFYIIHVLRKSRSPRSVKQIVGKLNDHYFAEKTITEKMVRQNLTIFERFEIIESESSAHNQKRYRYSEKYDEIAPTEYVFTIVFHDLMERMTGEQKEIFREFSVEDKALLQKATGLITMEPSVVPDIEGGMADRMYNLVRDCASGLASVVQLEGDEFDIHLALIRSDSGIYFVYALVLIYGTYEAVKLPLTQLEYVNPSEQHLTENIKMDMLREQAEQYFALDEIDIGAPIDFYKVELRFTPKGFERMSLMPIDQYVSVIDMQSYLFELEMPPTESAFTWLFEFGSEVTVVHPPEFKERFQVYLAEITHHHLNEDQQE